MYLHASRNPSINTQLYISPVMSKRNSRRKNVLMERCLLYRRASDIGGAVGSCAPLAMFSPSGRFFWPSKGSMDATKLDIHCSLAAGTCVDSFGFFLRDSREVACRSRR